MLLGPVLLIAEFHQFILPWQTYWHKLMPPRHSTLHTYALSRLTTLSTFAFPPQREKRGFFHALLWLLELSKRQEIDIVTDRNDEMINNHTIQLFFHFTPPLWSHIANLYAKKKKKKIVPYRTSPSLCTWTTVLSLLLWK